LYLKQEEYQALKWEGETVREGIRSLVLPSSLFFVVAVALGLVWRKFFCGARGKMESTDRKAGRKWVEHVTRKN
jgi:hypothetical protein